MSKKQAKGVEAPAAQPVAAPETTPTSTPAQPVADKRPAPPPNEPPAYDEAADDAAALAAWKAAVSSGSGQPENADAPLTEEQLMEQAATGGSASTEASPEGQPAEGGDATKGPQDHWAQLKAYQDPPKGQDAQLPPEDQRLVRALQQLQAQERELVARRQLEGLAPDEVAEAKRLLAAKRAAKTDPEVWFREAGWDKETIENYIKTGGETPLKPLQAEFEGKISTLQQKIEQLQGLIAQQQEAQAIQTFKGVIPQHLSANVDLYPHLTTYYENPVDQMEAVWSVIHHARTVEKESLTVGEAAGRLEKVLAKEAEKFAKVQSKKNPPATTKTVTKPQTPTLTNQAAGGKGAPDSQNDDFDALDQIAVKQFQDALRKSRQASA